MTQQVLFEDGYVLMVFSGELLRDSFSEAFAAALGAQPSPRGHRRALFDFSDVETVRFDPMTLGEAVRGMTEQGIRIAIASNKPATFGVGRQIALFSGVEGVAINVFELREAAAAWLLEIRE